MNNLRILIIDLSKFYNHLSTTETLFFLPQPRIQRRSTYWTRTK